MRVFAEPMWVRPTKGITGNSGDTFAADYQHSHLVAGSSALSRHSPNSAEEARNCGDAVIGINPATDSIAAVTTLVEMLDEIIRRYDIPTQSAS